MLVIFPQPLYGAHRSKLEVLKTDVKIASKTNTPTSKPIEIFINNNLDNHALDTLPAKIVDVEYGMTMYLGSKENKLGVCYPTDWKSKERFDVYFFSYKDIAELNPDYLLTSKRRHKHMFDELGITGIGPIEKSLNTKVFMTANDRIKYPDRMWYENVPEYLVRMGDKKISEFIEAWKDKFCYTWYDSYTSGDACEPLEKFTNDKSMILHNLLVRDDWKSKKRNLILAALKSVACNQIALSESEELLSILLESN